MGGSFLSFLVVYAPQEGLKEAKRQSTKQICNIKWTCTDMSLWQKIDLLVMVGTDMGVMNAEGDFILG